MMTVGFAFMQEMIVCMYSGPRVYSLAAYRPNSWHHALSHNIHLPLVFVAGALNKVMESVPH